MVANTERRDHHPSDHRALGLGEEGGERGEDAGRVAGGVLPRERVVALPDVIEAGLLERSDAADVVANVVAEALRRDPERDADPFLLQLGAGTCRVLI
jgi:hypothetical protein